MTSQNNHAHLADRPEYPQVHLPGAHKDPRGVIQNLVTDGVASVVVIYTEAGTVRANHKHTHDDHICYVVLGKVDYYWRDLPNLPVRKRTFIAGEAYYTPADVEHTMHFPEQSCLVVMSRQSRTPEEYDAEIVRAPDLRLLFSGEP